jgi:hypothetical protein
MKVLAWGAAAIPDFVIGAVYIVAWIDRGQFSESTLRWLVVLLAIEFVLLPVVTVFGVIAAANPPRAVKLSCGGCALPFIFGAAFWLSAWSRVEANWWILIGSIVLVVNRAIPAASSKVSVHDRTAIGVYTLLSLLAFIIAFFVAFGAPIPKLGITDEVAVRLEIHQEQQPVGYIAWGAIFFPLCGAAAVVSERVATKIEKRKPHLQVG